MKKFTFLNLIAIICIAFSLKAQVNHNLIGYDFYFSPDTLYMQAGDTVRFSSSGYHSATEVNYADWIADTTNAIGFDVGFGAPTFAMWFVVNTVGTHYYNCRPHASMGMKGVIIVNPSTGIQETVNQNKSLAANVTANKLTVWNKEIKTISLIDYTGKKVFESNKVSQTEKQEFDIPEITKGIYIVSVVLNSGKVIACKVVY